MTKIRWILLAGGLIIFAVTAFFVTTQDELQFDTVIREWFYSLRNDTLTPIVRAITYLGNWQTIVLLCIVLLFFKQTRSRYGYIVSASALFVTFFNKGVKQLFNRTRPDESLHLIEEGGLSFTSGHSITSMLIYGLLIYLVRKHYQDSAKKNVLTVILCIPLIFVGISRIYLGVHFPTDVIGGWSLGAAILMIVISIYDKIIDRAPGILDNTPV